MKSAKNLGLTEWRVARRKRPDQSIVPANQRPEVFTVASVIEGEQAKAKSNLSYDWLREEGVPQHVSFCSEEEWLAERAKHALLMLRECVEVDPGKHGGIPVLRGTRFPVAQVFAEMSEGISIVELAADFDLDVEVLKQLLEALAINLDRPFAK
jgi:uncharacterized protein (DUF433 family)